MSEWIVWLVIAGILVILEIFTGTFYLLMIALGVAAGGLASWAGTGGYLPYVVAVVVGSAATVGLRLTGFGKTAKSDAARDPNVNLDIGQTLVVDEWKAEGSRSVARVMYRGAMWSIELAPGANAQPGEFVVREVRGSHLIVANHN